MKKVFAALLIVLAAVSVISCRAARKPEQPQNRTFIVPEVITVSFEAVDLKAAPKVVRDVARAMEDRDATAWAQSGGSAFLVVSQAEKTKKYKLEVDQVLQRNPEQGFTWLDVKLVYNKRKEPESTENTVFTVVRADVKTPPNGVGFTIAGLETGGTPSARPQARSGPPPVQPPQTGVTIEQPQPNQEITSPVKVQGSVKGQGQMRIRLSTRGGQIIKEENLAPAPGTGAFSLDMTYSPPEMAAPGEIAVIAVSGGDEKVLARVPVLIK